MQEERKTVQVDPETHAALTTLARMKNATIGETVALLTSSAVDGLEGDQALVFRHLMAETG